MKNLPKIMFYVMTVLLVSLIAFMLTLTVTEMPPYGYIGNPTNNEVYRRYVYKGPYESGGLNMVGNILIDYRGYDTLLESTVLFATVVSIMLVWGTSTTSHEEKEHH